MWLKSRLLAGGTLGNERIPEEWLRGTNMQCSVYLRNIGVILFHFRQSQSHFPSAFWSCLTENHISIHFTFKDQKSLHKCCAGWNHQGNDLGSADPPSPKSYLHPPPHTQVEDMEDTTAVLFSSEPQLKAVWGEEQTGGLYPRSTCCVEVFPHAQCSVCGLNILNAVQ